MKHILPVAFESIYENFYNEEWWESEEGQRAIQLACEAPGLICSDYISPKQRLKNFVNSYLVEKAFVGAYTHLHFHDIDDHFFLHQGAGNPGCDCYDNYGREIEIKKFKTESGFDNWLYGVGNVYYASHGCNIYLCYVVGSKKSYVVKNNLEFDRPEPETKELCRKQIKVDLL